MLSTVIERFRWLHSRVGAVKNPVPKLSILNIVIGKFPLKGFTLEKPLSVIFLRLSVKAFYERHKT